MLGRVKSLQEFLKLSESVSELALHRLSLEHERSDGHQAVVALHALLVPRAGQSTHSNQVEEKKIKDIQTYFPLQLAKYKLCHMPPG